MDSGEFLEQQAQIVHATWRDVMLSQGRVVATERMAWDTLPEQDRHIDRAIALAVAAEYSGRLRTAEARVTELEGLLTSIRAYVHRLPLDMEDDINESLKRGGQ